MVTRFHFTGAKSGKSWMGNFRAGSGPQIWSLGPKISKLPLEKPCRTQWSTLQTEPYVASYGRKPFRAGCPPTEANVSADKTSVVSADKTSVVPADKTSVVSADKTSVVSQDTPTALPIQERPRGGRPCGQCLGDGPCGQCLGHGLGDHRCLVC